MFTDYPPASFKNSSPRATSSHSMGVICGQFNRLSARVYTRSLDQAARLNVAKILGRWPVTPDWGALFDVDFPPEEQLPRQITMMQNKGSRFDLAD